MGEEWAHLPLFAPVPLLCPHPSLKTNSLGRGMICMTAEGKSQGPMWCGQMSLHWGPQKHREWLPNLLCALVFVHLLEVRLDHVPSTSNSSKLICTGKICFPKGNKNPLVMSYSFPLLHAKPHTHSVHRAVPELPPPQHRFLGERTLWDLKYSQLCPESPLAFLYFSVKFVRNRRAWRTPAIFLLLVAVLECLKTAQTPVMPC